MRKLSNRIQNSIDEVRTHIEGARTEIVRIGSCTLRVQEHALESQKQIRVTMEGFNEFSQSAENLDEQAQSFHSII